MGTLIVELGPEYWRALQSWARQRQLFSPTDNSIVTVAAGIPRKLPTEKQCVRLVEIKTRLEEEGFQTG
jgi:hypothetical protein